MKNLTLKHIAKACNGTLYQAENHTEEIMGAVLDSRLVKEGYLFFATKGEKVDGHSFIPSVYEKGAACVVTEKTPEELGTEFFGAYILVEDSFQALKDVAEYYRSQLTIPVVGITGSVGKTSTKEFIAGVLSQKYNVLKTEGNYNNEVGLPLTLLKIREEHEVAVVEMGISHFGEMHRMSKIARPDICVLTNIGQCHLENLLTREGILKAKTEIFDYMSEDAYVCINGDDDLLATISQVKGHKPLCFGLEESNQVFADNMESRGLFGSSAVLHMEGNTYPMEIPLPGRHMVYNALAAATVGRLLELTIPEIIEGIAHVEPTGGRSNIVKTPDKVLIDDCYNANPISMKAALDLLQTADTRQVAILGDMFELGANEKELHAQVGRYAIEKGIDVVLIVGSLSKYMYDAAIEEWNGELDVRYFETKDELMEELDDLIMPQDTILIKASHGMQFETIVHYLEK